MKVRFATTFTEEDLRMIKTLAFKKEMYVNELIVELVKKEIEEGEDE